jgi:CheY-like chemotaxis protein
MKDLTARPILMVEDMDFDFEMTQRGFRRMGVQAPLIRHTNAASAAGFLSNVSVDSSASPLPGIVILDLNLPDGDGRELLSHIKRDDSLKDIPVVVWSASNDPTVIAECYREGASSYICKASDQQVAENAIQQFVLYWLKTVTLSPGNP